MTEIGKFKNKTEGAHFEFPSWPSYLSFRYVLVIYEDKGACLATAPRRN